MKNNKNRFLVLSCVLLVSIAITTASQQSAVTVDGFVREKRTAEPIAQAEVKLLASTGKVYTETSNDVGHFMFRNIPPGEYSVDLHRDGYGPLSKVNGSKSIAVTAGKDVNGVVLQLLQLAILTGRVMDVDGTPLVGAKVELLEDYYPAGSHSLVPVQTRDQRSGVSDDQGRFRIFFFDQGNYYLRVSQILSSFTDPARFGATYFARTPDWTMAGSIVLRGGEFNIGEMRVLPPQELGVRVSGSVTTSLSQLASQNNPLYLELFPLLANGMTNNAEVIIKPVSFSTSFSFQHVLPGRYELFAMERPGTGIHTGAVRFEVRGNDIDGLNLSMGPAVRLKGRVETNGVATFPISNVSVSFRQIGATLPSKVAGVQSNGDFELELFEGNYSLSFAGITGSVYISDIQFGGYNINPQSIEIGSGASQMQIFLKEDGAIVQGQVKTKQGEYASGATIALVPNSQDLNIPDRYQTTTSDRSGHYEFHGIAPGEYRLFAWEVVKALAFRNSTFLEKYKNEGKQVSVRASQRFDIDLSMIPSEF